MFTKELDYKSGAGPMPIVQPKHTLSGLGQDRSGLVSGWKGVRCEVGEGEGRGLTLSPS